MLKSLLNTLTRAQNAPIELRREYLMNFVKKSFLVIWVNISSKLEKISPNF